MSAALPTLTPLDTPLFDPDVIQQMEEHWNEGPACGNPDCDNPAAYRVATRCCNAVGQLCGLHRALLARIVEDICARGRGVKCAYCKHHFREALMLADIAIVSTL